MRLIPHSQAFITIARTPLIPRNSPLNDSSPIKAQSERSAVICPVSFSKFTIIGRSYIGPSFFISAGARLKVMWADGSLKPQFLNALFTLSRLSFTAASGNPTMSNAGSPSCIEDSTSTLYPSIPFIPKLLHFTTIFSSKNIV